MKIKNNQLNQDDPFDLFNFADFKKWIKNQDDSPNKIIIGLTVESKISTKKLLSKIECQDGDIEEVTKDFKKNGGIINEVNGHIFLIEVASGTFLVHRMYVTKF